MIKLIYMIYLILKHLIYMLCEASSLHLVILSPPAISFAIDPLCAIILNYFI